MPNVILNTEGNSMYGLISNRDKIIVNTCDFSPKFGDVLVYKKNHNYIAHRCYFAFFKYIITAGDNCNRFEIIRKHDVIGLVEFVIKDNGYHKLIENNWYRTKYTLFLIFFIVANKFTFNSIRTTQKNRYIKLKQKICRFAYRKRRKLQQLYLERIKIKG